MLVDINLLPQKERDRPIFVIAALLIVLLSLIIWAVFFFMAQAQENSRADLSNQASNIADEQEAIRQQLEAVSGMNEEQQLKVTVDWAESYQFDTVPLLGELVSILPERGFFDQFSYIGPNSATLTLQFDTTREAAYYLTQLKTSELLASASLDSIQNQEAADEEDGEIAQEETIMETPRYLASYTLVFADDRIPAEGTAELTEGETEADADADAAGNESTDAVPEETEGDGNE